MAEHLVDDGLEVDHVLVVELFDVVIQLDVKIGQKIVDVHHHAVAVLGDAIHAQDCLFVASFQGIQVI